MDNQTTIDDRQNTHDEPTMGLRSSISRFVQDLFTLAGLQWQLLVEDAREAAKSSLLLMAIAIGGVILLLCAIPVALLGFAHLLSQAGLSLAFALLLVAALSGAIGLTAAIYAWRKIQGSLGVFDRSHTELRNNIAWLKKVTTREEPKPARQDSDLYY